jgi:peptidoglycan-associated lipoprotein
MKHSFLSYLLVLGLALAVSSTGCKSPKKPVTPIPNAPETVANPDTTGGGLNANKPVRPTVPVTPGNIPPIASGPKINELPTGPVIKPIDENPNGTLSNITDRERFEGRDTDRVIFQTQVVHFDFDSSVVKPGEQSKLDFVADHLKQNAADDLLIEGHCDERGTPEYNRALGERRAQALRETLAKKGVSPDRVRTLSWGEEKPVDEGHNEAAWSKNRRGEFVRLLPKK